MNHSRFFYLLLDVWDLAVVTFTSALKAIVIMLICFAVVVAANESNSKQKVYIYNWSEYIAPTTLKNFQNATTIQPIYDIVDSNELFDAKLLIGNSGYDIVVPSSYFATKHIQLGLYEKLDLSKLPNHSNLDPRILNKLSSVDPNLLNYTIPYLWGTTAFVINQDKVKELLPNADLNSWSLLFEVENLKVLSKCGVFFLDSPQELFATMLMYLGYNPNSRNPSEIKLAEEKLKTLRPYIKKFHNSDGINLIASGDICVSMAWSGDALGMIDRQKQLGKATHFSYILPKEGASIWVDTMAIPSSSKNKDQAYAFMNFILEPKVVAEITNYVKYANPNAKALPFLNKAITDNKDIMLDNTTFDKLYMLKAHSPSFKRELTRSWQRIKTGL